MLIKAFGEYWSPDVVDWGRQGGQKGSLWGVAKPYHKPNFDVDLWDAVAVYCLFLEYRPVYVGKADKTALGPRLRQHLRDRHVGRWDMFSFYSLSKPNRTSRNAAKAGMKSAVTPETIVQTIESVAIRLVNPPLNRRFESIPGAIEVVQEHDPRPVRSYLEEILDRLNLHTSLRSAGPGD